MTENWETQLYNIVLPHSTTKHVVEGSIAEKLKIREKFQTDKTELMLDLNPQLRNELETIIKSWNHTFTVIENDATAEWKGTNVILRKEVENKWLSGIGRFRVGNGMEGKIVSPLQYRIAIGSAQEPHLYILSEFVKDGKTTQWYIASEYIKIGSQKAESLPQTAPQNAAADSTAVPNPQGNDTLTVHKAENLKSEKPSPSTPQKVTPLRTPTTPPVSPSVTSTRLSWESEQKTPTVPRSNDAVKDASRTTPSTDQVRPVPTPNTTTSTPQEWNDNPYGSFSDFIRKHPDINNLSPVLSDAPSGTVNRSPESEKVALTFDICSNHSWKMEKNVLESLSIMRQNPQYPVTLFVSWEALKNTAIATALATIADSFPHISIQPHGLHHHAATASDIWPFHKSDNFAWVPGTGNLEKAYTEILENAKQIEALTRKRPKYFRSASLYTDSQVVAMANRLGMRMVWRTDDNKSDAKRPLAKFRSDDGWWGKKWNIWEMNLKPWVLFLWHAINLEGVQAVYKELNKNKNENEKLSTTHLG